MDTTHGAGSGGARPGRAHRDVEADGYTPNPALVVLEHEGALAAGRTLHHARQAATRQARRRVEALRSETAQASSISPSGCSKGFFVAWTLVVDLCVGLLTLCTGCVAGARHLFSGCLASARAGLFSGFSRDEKPERRGHMLSGCHGRLVRCFECIDGPLHCLAAPVRALFVGAPPPPSCHHPPPQGPGTVGRPVHVHGRRDRAPLGPLLRRVRPARPVLAWVHPPRPQVKRRYRTSETPEMRCLRARIRSVGAPR